MITPRKGLLLVALVLLLCALLQVRWTGWLTRPITVVVETVLYPADWIASNAGSDPLPASHLRSDDPLDKQLATAKQRLEMEQAWNNQLWQENQRLHQQLNAFNAIKEILDLESIKLVEARVSRYNADKVNPTMKILRGSLHGIKPEDAVVYEADLLGFVTDEIGPAHATVALVNRPEFVIEVNIMPPNGIRPGEQGWPVRDLAKWDADERVFVCEEMDKDVAKFLRQGDIVRVSDTLRDSAKGFMLGVIKRIEEDRSDPHKLRRVVIVPRTPIGPQRRVTVLTKRTD